MTESNDVESPEDQGSASSHCSSARVWWINRHQIPLTKTDSVATGFDNENMARNHRMDGQETVCVVERDVWIDRWIGKIEDRIEGFRVMAGHCRDLDDYREASRMDVKREAYSQMLKELASMKKSQ